MIFFVVFTGGDGIVNAKRELSLRWPFVITQDKLEPEAIVLNDTYITYSLTCQEQVKEIHDRWLKISLKI